MSIITNYNDPTTASYQGEVSVDFQYSGQAVTIYGQTESLYTKSITEQTYPWYRIEASDRSFTWGPHEAVFWSQYAIEGSVYHGQAIVSKETEKIMGWMCAHPGKWYPEFKKPKGVAEVTIIINSQADEVKAQVGALFKAYIEKAVQGRHFVETELSEGRIDMLPLEWLTATAPAGNEMELAKKAKTVQLLFPVMNFSWVSKGALNVLGAKINERAIRV